MFRIGIIGTENSHAMAFAKLANLPDPATGKYRYPDVRIVGVYGPDPDSPQKIVEEAGAEFVAATPEDFFGKVDAMMVTCRKGSLHADYAMPFIKKGIPVFIDKPFTSDVAQANALVEAAKASGAKLSGGSGCKLAYDVEILQTQVKALAASGDLVSAAMNFAADTDSEYDGFFFYSPHLTEMMLTVFGSDVKAVQAFENSGSRTVVWRYAGFDVTAHYTKDVGQSTAVLFSKKGNVVRHIDLSMIYARELDGFVNMLRSGEMAHCYSSLVRPVEVITAINESANTGKLVSL